MAKNESHKGPTSRYHEIFCGGGDEMLPAEKEALAFMVASGSTDAQISAYYGIGRTSLLRWKRENPEFFKVFQDNKKVANDNVRKALYDTAVGYDIVETKVFIEKGEAIFVDIIKQIPGNVVAQKYWLNNREPDEWKDQVYQTNENTNKEVPTFDLSNLTDEELDVWLKMYDKVKPA